MLSIELPPGSQLRDTEAVTETITKRLRSRPEVESVFVDGGRLPPTVVDVGKAALTINYVPKSQAKTIPAAARAGNHNGPFQCPGHTVLVS